ncbi:hypothetical protein PFISCL1PPCAC_9536 [Pristionchus fissidentatus]|uniref:Cytosolic fatty-acid binding proteins domain-containing protein n=1 Tax=Pristionchus fissidentatus TaxID=1538716 RepID=A0AAV5VIG5_9BILA|nr:hypothetical protein PFISCL1PPCAC_9536 [Pristionchus fissidentatus]
MHLLPSLVLLSSLVLIHGYQSSTALSDKFYGKFTLDHSENFDEYLEAKGYSWFTRKLIVFATFEKIFEKVKDSTFNYENLTTKKNVYYKNVTLGQKFTGEGLDSSPRAIIFDMKDGHLLEKHVPIYPYSEVEEEEYEYYFDGDFLVIKMEANGVVGKRFYKRVVA